MSAGRSAPRYERMALLYPRSRALQSQLSEYFIVVVRLCHQLLKLSKKSILGQLVSYPGDSELKNYQSEFDRWASSIKEEVGLLMGEEQSSHFKSLLRFSESEVHRKRAKARVHVLSCFSTYDYQKTWKETRKAGNTTFHSRTTEYQEWKSATESCTLVCTGKLGSGKSVLLANIIDDLNLQHVKHPVTYFFCRHDITESLSASTVLGSLARQFLYSLSNLTKIEKLLEENTEDLDLEKIEIVLKAGLPPDFKAYCVLDGLDECDNTQRKALIQRLRNFQKSFTLIICVSFRLEAGNALNLRPDQFVKHRTITVPVDNPDIGDFINAELETHINSGALAIGDPRLIIEIEDALLQGAQGMFLWVALQVEALCFAKTDDAIRRALADLPKDLPETFSRILKRSGELGRDYQMRTLGLVTSAHRPLSTEELREALSVVPGDHVWNQSRLLNDIYSTLACCGSLIIIDEEEWTVRLTHHSVKQFLFDNESPTGSILTRGRANAIMADVVVTYLNYGVFDTQVSGTTMPEIPGGAAPSTVIQTLKAPSQVRNLALKFLRGRRQRNFNMGKAIADASRDLKAPLDQFSFYPYARAHWVHHARFITEQNPTIYKLLLTLLKREISVDGGENNGQILFPWAAANGHEDIIELLLATGKAKIDAKDDSSQTALWKATGNGHNAVVRLLLGAGADLEVKDGVSGLTALSHAAKNGHEATARLLLDAGANFEAESNSGWTPLSYAAENGHEAVARLLLDVGANIEAKSNSGGTALSHAVQNGHEAVVRLLLDAGANVEAKEGIFGQTSLSSAAEKGQKAMVQLLQAYTV
jgi:ankyrin repeat domain-containing protein 50